jgi:hypothetical protein
MTDAPDTEESYVETQVRDSRRAQCEAMVAGDADLLGEQLADGFTLTHMTGYVQSRGEWLAQVASGEMTYHSMRDVTVSVEDADTNEPVLTADTRTDATIWGSRGTWPLRLEVHFARHDHTWKATRSVASTW